MAALRFPCDSIAALKGTACVEYTGSAMFCANCGAQLTAGNAFCQQCGSLAAANPPAGGVVQDVAKRLRKIASTEELEGFSLRAMFSEVFKRRTPEEIEEHFLTGTSKATPLLSDVETGWPKPWF